MTIITTKLQKLCRLVLKPAPNPLMASILAHLLCKWGSNWLRFVEQWQTADCSHYAEGSPTLFIRNMHALQKYSADNTSNSIISQHYTGAIGCSQNTLIDKIRMFLCHFLAPVNILNDVEIKLVRIGYAVASDQYFPYMYYNCSIYISHFKTSGSVGKSMKKNSRFKTWWPHI